MHRKRGLKATMEGMPGTTQEIAIAEITRRLVDYFHPERICLFGSAARG